ncbi:pyridoxal 5'-phosphate synthase [Actinacidiphila glaucinigra]|uniref:pyridoxine/pyridoxamine 5'-phosphate oxidase n=1 Tax=Actinacidiphila glaucinigra TaxID=235986 RepID=UPI002DDC2D82|nr:pyridoxal 5'-phosphate synthase [Actinacidiphila glaucinigra]WSD63480.1 pyridoxal 5'-phosphate synthase [Actinacidiphila glaucinigra]
MTDDQAPVTADALRERMRSAPVLAGPLPSFDPAGAGPEPGPLFARWLAYALDDGVPEPHVMTLSTADAGGRPSARVLMLRGVDLDRPAFDFASDTASRKGRDLADRPRAALTWYWPRHGRQIRVTGPVETLDRDAARRDFLGRREASRVAGFTGVMSAPLEGRAAYEEARRRAAGHVAAHPDDVPEGHTVYRLVADEAEFWQAAPAQGHVRLRYTRDSAAPGGWTRTLLWP